MLKCSNVKIKNGFTVIELLTVIIIIGILTAIAIPNYQSAQKNLALQRSTTKLASDIRKVQEMAMSAKELPTGGVPEGGYGIIFEINWNNKRYRLYADTDGGNEFYTPADTIVDPPYVELEKGIFIYDINTSPQKVTINFKPPDPIIKIKYQESGGEINEAIITLCIEGADCLVSTNKKTISVNKVGLVDVD